VINGKVQFNIPFILQCVDTVPLTQLNFSLKQQSVHYNCHKMESHLLLASELLIACHIQTVHWFMSASFCDKLLWIITIAQCVGNVQQSTWFQVICDDLQHFI